MRNYIFRNSPIEPFFDENEYSFSEYGSITNIPKNIDRYIWFYILPNEYDHQILSNEINSYFNRIKYILKKILPEKEFLIFTLEGYSLTQFAAGDFNLILSINDFNKKIVDLMTDHNNVKVLNFNNFLRNYIDKELIDWKFFYLFQMQLNPKLAFDFKKWFTSQINVIEYKRKKCLIIDLDNTIWGGILGEDGLNGLQLGEDYPGNAFLYFQKILVELVRNGVILAVCSKNNESDVLELWEKHPYNLINDKYISAYRINWNNKASNIKELIEELNIGADSVVFVDDNPTERELVKQFHPLIETPQFPSSPYLLANFAKDLVDKYFKIYVQTKEDIEKTQQYKAKLKSSELLKEFSDITDYLINLEIQIEILNPTELIIPRISQMTQKTNQFNLTTKRYNETQIREFIKKENLIFCINVKDRFGDNGVTGLIMIILDKVKKIAIIDTLLLSCRILGKGIEDAFCFYVFNKLKQEGYNTLLASYIPTIKNSQVESYYDKLGFTLLSSNSEGIKSYQLYIKTNNFLIKPYYQIIDRNERQN